MAVKVAGYDGGVSRFTNTALVDPGNPTALLNEPPSTESVTVVDPEAATPVPLNETITFGCAGSLLVIVRMPFTAPAAVGANVTVTGVVAPGCTVNGMAGEVTVTEALELAIALTVNAAVPVFEILNGTFAVWPTVTLPNCRVVVGAEIVGVPLPLEPGIVSVPGPVMLKLPPPDPVVPAPVPDAVTLKLPVAPAKPPVPLETVMVAGPLAVGVPAKICDNKLLEPLNAAVRVPAGLPLVMVMVIGAEPDRAALVRLKFELNVPVPTPERVTVPVAVMMPPELVPLPVMVRVLFMVVPAPVTPVPVNGTVTLACAGSFVASVSVPVCRPAAVGANCTDTLNEAPAATLADVAPGVKTALLLDMELTLSVAVPTLLIVSVWD